jgi:hypothetical protein
MENEKKKKKTFQSLENSAAQAGRQEANKTSNII